LTFFLLVASAGMLYAGVAGKISGRLIDKTTHEPLISANVIIKGTSLGASSDLDGNYSILNIPPGVYTVSISVVGYRKVQI